MSFFIVFVCIFLSGITVEPSHSARLGSDHQRVHLVNWSLNAQLSLRKPMDSQRRYVHTGKLGNSEKKEWRLVPSQNGSYFEIIHHQYNEPLCAVPDDLAYDGERRDVVTWIPGPHDMHCLWDITLTPKGHYLIKNVQYGEYMYATNFSSAGKVFLWRKDEAPTYVECFWDIININRIY